MTLLRSCLRKVFVKVILFFSKTRVLEKRKAIKKFNMGRTPTQFSLKNYFDNCHQIYDNSFCNLL